MISYAPDDYRYLTSAIDLIASHCLCSGFFCLYGFRPYGFALIAVVLSCLSADFSIVFYSSIVSADVDTVSILGSFYVRIYARLYERPHR